MTTYYFSDNPNGYATGKRFSLDRPCVTIMAAGMGGDSLGHWHLTDDGAPDMTRPPGPDKPPYRVPPMSEIGAIRPNGLTVATTFAGAGGSSLGYRLAGFRVVWANEFVPIAQDSYRANAMPYTVVDGRDVKEVRAEDILGAAGLAVGELDVFDGSPPCQAFSTAGTRERGWGKDKHYEHGAAQKNEELFYEYIRLRDGLMPRVFVAENVSGLVKGKAKGFFLDILKELKRGYRVAAPLLDAQWLGVPQARQRIVFVGVREDLGVDPPVPSPLPYRYSVRDALPWLSQVVHDTMGSFKSGGDITDRPSVTIMSSPRDSSHFKVRGDAKVIHDTGRPGQSAKDVTERPCPTITAGPDDPADGGGPRNHFHIVQTSSAPHDRKGESKSLDDPSPTVMARRVNFELEIKTGRGGSRRAREEGKAQNLDEPIASVLAGGGRDGNEPQFFLEAKGSPAGARPHVEPETDISRQAIGAEYDRLNPGQQSDKYFSLVRADAEKPSPTITAAGGQNAGIACVVHPTEKRKFTILELKRLCSFPDDFELQGTYAQQWERLGNSVPPLMMFAVAREIRDRVLLPARGAARTAARPARSPGRSTTGKRPKDAGRKPAASKGPGKRGSSGKAAGRKPESRKPGRRSGRAAPSAD